jgi:hypothetical protein
LIPASIMLLLDAASATEGADAADERIERRAGDIPSALAS